jgi:hypothetical protein
VSRLATATWILAIGLLTTQARAQSEGVDACIRADTRMQELRKEGKLREARKKAPACMLEECPDMIRKHCATLAEEIGREIPTILFDVRDAAGTALVEVQVWVDDELVAERLDGRPVELDPGPHRAHVEWAGSEVQVTSVAKAGEQRQVVKLLVGEVAPVPRPNPWRRPELPHRPTEATDGTADDATSGSDTTVAWVLGGVGVAALGAFTYFALTGQKKENGLDDCTPACSPDRVDAVERSYLLADISLGVGLVSLGAATYLFLSSSKSEPRSPQATRASVVVGHEGAGLAIHGRF